MNKLERSAYDKSKKEFLQVGKGKYLYRNNTNATLILPKISIDNIKALEKNQTFIGDDYFMFMVKTNELKIVKNLEEKEEVKKEDIEMEEKKLILDQPDQITTNGKLEHVVKEEGCNNCCDKNSVKKENKNNEPKENVLINENPIDGIKIIMN